MKILITLTPQNVSDPDPEVDRANIEEIVRDEYGTDVLSVELVEE